jgi:two-component system OmpR family sensor kinase
LRTRLVALTLVLLAAAAVLIGLVTALAVRHSLVSRLDADLAAVSNGPGRNRPPVTAGDAPPNGGGPPDLITVSITDGQVTDARVRTRGGSDRVFPQSDLPPVLTVPPGARPTTLDLPTLGQYRVVANTRLNGDVQVTGLPEAQLQQTVTNLVTTELIVAAITLAVAGVIGAVLVSRELQPLERVATTARRVSALPLDRGEVELAERVPDADPATEVGQVGAALNHMLDHVGAALEARQDSEMQLRQFVADASHELRTPLAAIRGYAELTRRGPLSEEATHAL